MLIYVIKSASIPKANLRELKAKINILGATKKIRTVFLTVENCAK